MAVEPAAESRVWAILFGVFTGFRPGILVRDQLTDEFLARPQSRYRILASWAGTAACIVMGAWYAVAVGG